jgi:hypothetical protein
MMFDGLMQCSSTWGKRTPGGYAKTSLKKEYFVINTE